MVCYDQRHILYSERKAREQAFYLIQQQKEGLYAN